MSLTVNAVVAPPLIPFPGNPFHVDVSDIHKHGGGVAACQDSASELQTPGPEGLTSVTGYRTGDLWVSTAIPYHLSYRMMRL